MRLRYVLLLAVLLCVQRTFPQQWVVSDALRRAACCTPGNFRVYEGRGGRGFLITEAGGDEPVVLAYSEQGHLERALRNPNFQWLLSMLSAPGVHRKPAWTYENDLPEYVEPLLTDTWHQYAPYNARTPVVDGQHCATGCVAQSMAQVIRFHRYARGGTSYTYTDSLGSGQTLTAAIPVDGYDFDQMLDEYEEGYYTARQLDALTRLLSDCGIAVNMKYGVQASSAQCVFQSQALVNLFGYDEGLQMYYRDFFTYREWVRMLKEELAQGRPVLMAARSPSLSHAFCCDGYDADGLFHLNLGEGGDADGYYYLPYLTPKQPEWYDEDSPEGGMNLLQSATVGIRPAGGTPSAQSYAFGMAAIEPLSGQTDRRGELTLVTRDMGNVGWNVCPGPVELLLKKEDETVAVLAHYDHDFQLCEVTGACYTDTLTFVVPEEVGDGLYRVVAAVQDDQGRWNEVRTSVGTPNYLLLQVEQGMLSLFSDEAGIARLTLEHVEFPDTIVRGTNPEFAFTLRNGNTEYCGRFYVILEPQDGGNDCLIQYQGLTMDREEQTRRSFHRTRVNIKAGTYHLRLSYDQNLFNDSLVWFSQEPLKTVQVVEKTDAVASPRISSACDRWYDLQGRPSSGQPLCVGKNRKVLKPTRK